MNLFSESNRLKLCLMGFVLNFYLFFLLNIVFSLIDIWTIQTFCHQKFLFLCTCWFQLMIESFCREHQCQQVLANHSVSSKLIIQTFAWSSKPFLSNTPCILVVVCSEYSFDTDVEYLFIPYKSDLSGTFKSIEMQASWPTPWSQFRNEHSYAPSSLCASATTTSNCVQPMNAFSNQRNF